MQQYDTIPEAIAVEIASENSFSPFGKMLIHPGDRERFYLDAAFEAASDARPTAWVNNPVRTQLPATLSKLERHPHSPQAFIPMRATPYLAVVCASDCDGEPDLRSVRAFLVEWPCGILFARNTWHHGIMSLAEQANFVVLMASVGDDNDEFRELDQPIVVQNDQR